MVFTRGSKEGEDKEVLPQRECRSNRANLEEPEDDIIWESDDPILNKPRNKKDDSFNYRGQHKTKQNSWSKVKTETEESDKGESDSDEELFVQKRNAHSQNLPCDTRKSSRHRRSPIRKEYTLNLDEISDENEKSDNENGLRRSLRKKNFKNESSQSWLVGPKTLRGYPNMINSSEPEHDEPRAAEKSRRFKRATSKNTMKQRQSSRPFRPVREGNNRCVHSERNHISSKVGRRTRYSNNFHEQEDEDDAGDEDDEGCKKETNEVKTGVVAIQNRNPKNQLYSRPRRRQTVKVQYDEDSNSYENVYASRYLSRRRPSSRRLQALSSKETLLQKEEQISESENSAKEEEPLQDESKENINESKKIKRIREPILRDLKNGISVCEVPNKRMRKPVARLTYEVKASHRKKASSSASNSSWESSEDENRQGGASRGRTRYSLRQNRKTLSMKDPYEDVLQHRHKHKSSLAAYLNSPARKPVYSRKQKATHARDDTSSSSDEKAFEKRKAKSMSKARNRCLPVNMKPEDLQMGGIRERKVGSSLADIDPMTMDTNINFDSIGGLTDHIKALKEMILFPIMYPEIFKKFAVSPPRGVLFYGPPGTGKTLVARALANECSHDDRKIAFFMRKGADCLSKWVGESERQLRLLFDQAYQMRPSIIFFDEIDGLAPVRSSRQDQIHSSIVSTLLALLDGMDSRGEIVVIGATNRIDAIDPALRRPGRFDREFHFPLPSVEARKQILQINTKQWDPKPTSTMLNFLAEQTVGYCGADLKSLVGESALVALRSRYPQIYTSKQKLMLDVTSIQVKCKHFKNCLNKIVPAGQRATNAPGKKLSKVFQPLMKDWLQHTLSILKKSFPQGFHKTVLNRILHRPRLLLIGRKDQGQTTLLGPAILHALERIPTHRLDFPSLFSIAARAPEEACAQIFHEAKRNVPSILYVPLIDQLWNSASDSVRSTFLYLLNDLPSSVPVMFLATVESQYATLDPEIQQMFSSYRGEIVLMTNANRNQRGDFFRPIFSKSVFAKPLPAKKHAIDALPLAPPAEPRQLKQEEVQKLVDVEEASLRELRIFLRQICAKLAKNKMFYIFTKPVDLEEVPDYLQIISRPMDLETMMTKIDLHQYECAEDFLKDVEQIVTNALEYNPDRNPEDKVIRHRACTLRDTAYAYIKAEMDTDFEDNCREIRNSRTKRKQTLLTLPPHFMHLRDTIEVTIATESGKLIDAKANSQTNEAGDNKQTPVVTSSKKRKRRSNWSRGNVGSKKKKIDKDKSDCHKDLEENGEYVDSTGRMEECNLDMERSETSRSKSTDSDDVMINGHLIMEDSSNGSNKVTSAVDLAYGRCISDSIAEDRKLKMRSESSVDTCDTAVSSSEQGCLLSNTANEITIDSARLERVYETCLSATEDASIEELHHLYSVLSAMCKKHKKFSDRNPLLSEMESEISRFQKYIAE